MRDIVVFQTYGIVVKKSIVLLTVDIEEFRKDFAFARFFIVGDGLCAVPFSTQSTKFKVQQGGMPTSRRMFFDKLKALPKKCFFLAGTAGFEPANDRVKVCCLTA